MRCFTDGLQQRCGRLELQSTDSILRASHAAGWVLSLQQLSLDQINNDSMCPLGWHRQMHEAEEHASAATFTSRSPSIHVWNLPVQSAVAAATAAAAAFSDIHAPRRYRAAREVGGRSYCGMYCKPACTDNPQSGLHAGFAIDFLRARPFRQPAFNCR